MAVQRVYQTYFNSEPGDTYRLDIYDLDYTAGAAMTSLYGEPSANLPIELTTRHEGLNLRWDGDPMHLAQPIIGSALEVELLLVNATDRRIINAIKERPEHTLACELLRHDGNGTNINTGWDKIWKGVLSHESVSYAFSDLPLELSLAFSDGLALLRDQPYQDTDGSNFIGGLDSADSNSRHAPLRIQIGRCLKRLPHLALWGDADWLFSEQLDMFHWNHIDETNSNQIKSILDKSGCDQFTWYDERAPDGEWYRDSRLLTHGSSCYQILEDIMTTFGTSFFMWDSMFNVVSPFMQDSDSVLNGARKWRSDKRTMVDVTYQWSAANQPTSWTNGTDYPNYLDYSDLSETNYLISSKRSFLPPLARMYLTHVQAGSPAIFKQTGILMGKLTSPTSGTVMGPNGEFLTSTFYHFPLNSTEAAVQSEAELRLKMTLHVGHQGINSTFPERVGLQPYLKMKLKVGNQYLKQDVSLLTSSNFTADSDFGHIRIAVGNNTVPSGNDITTWFPLVISSDVEWTTTESWFYMPLLMPSVIEGGWDVIEYQDGDTVTEYPVGLNTRRDGTHSNQMRYDNALSQPGEYVKLPINMAIPAMPSSASDYEGVYIDLQVEAYENDGTLATYPNNNNFNSLGVLVENFRLLNGDDEYQSDAIYYSEASTAGLTTETVEAGETLLGTRSNSQKIVGALHVGNGHRTSNRASAYGEHWFSESGETFPTTDSGRGALQVAASSHFSHRKTAVNTFEMELLLRDHHYKLVFPQSRVRIHTGTSDTTIQVQSVSHNLVAGVQTVVGYEIDRDFTGTVAGTNEANVERIQGSGPNITGSVDIVRNNAVGGAGSLTQEQIDKLLAITINGSGQITDFTVALGSDPLDVSEVSGAASTTALSSLQSRVQDIERVTDNVTLDQSNNISQIATNQDAISANSILQTSTKQFVSQAQATQITTNQTSISNLNTTVDAIVTVVKDTSGGGGKGVYNDTTAGVTESYVGMTDTTMRVQAGAGNTGIDLAETSPGTIDMEVQAGSVGSEAAFTAIEIAGSSSSATATTTVNGSLVVVGNFNVDSGAVAGASLKLEEADLLGNNYIEIKAPISVTANTTLTLPDGAGTSGQALTTNGSGTLSWSDVVAKINPVVQNVLSINALNSALAPRLFIQGADGNGGVFFQVADDTSTNNTFTLPNADGTNGQALVTNGSGTLSFATVGGGGGGSSTHKAVLNYGFFDNNIRNVFIPLTNETETTSRQRYNVFVPTSAGEVKKFSMFVTGSKSGGTGGSIAVQKMTGTTTYTTLSTATFSSLTGYQPTVLTFSNATFSAGDRIYFFFTNGFGSSIGNMMGTIEIEYS